MDKEVLEVGLSISETNETPFIKVVSQETNVPTISTIDTIRVEVLFQVESIVEATSKVNNDNLKKDGKIIEEIENVKQV